MTMLLDRNYNEIKTHFSFEKYLIQPNFSQRKIIAKIRCSDHTPEIENGRHMEIPREERFCNVCDCEVIETEKHLLVESKCYENTRTKHQMMQPKDSLELLCKTDPENPGKYLLDLFAERKMAYDSLGK